MDAWTRQVGRQTDSLWGGPHITARNIFLIWSDATVNKEKRKTTHTQTHGTICDADLRISLLKHIISFGKGGVTKGNAFPFYFPFFIHFYFPNEYWERVSFTFSKGACVLIRDSICSFNMSNQQNAIWKKKVGNRDAKWYSEKPSQTSSKVWEAPHQNERRLPRA